MALAEEKRRADVSAEIESILGKKQKRDEYALLTARGVRSPSYKLLMNQFPPQEVTSLWDSLETRAVHFRANKWLILLPWMGLGILEVFLAFRNPNGLAFTAFLAADAMLASLLSGYWSQILTWQHLNFLQNRVYLEELLVTPLRKDEVVELLRRDFIKQMKVGFLLNTFVLVVGLAFMVRFSPLYILVFAVFLKLRYEWISASVLVGHMEALREFLYVPEKERSIMRAAYLWSRTYLSPILVMIAIISTILLGWRVNNVYLWMSAYVGLLATILLVPWFFHLKWRYIYGWILYYDQYWFFRAESEHSIRPGKLRKVWNEKPLIGLILGGLARPTESMRYT